MQIKKVKLKADGMSVEYEGTTSAPGPPHAITENPDAPVHPDLLDAFSRLKTALIKSIQLDWAFQFINVDMLTTAEEEAAISILRPRLNDYFSRIMDCVTVTGFSISGEDASRGVVVTGKIETKGKTTAINSPRVVFNQDVMGFEAQLESAIDECEKEVIAYMTEGKVGVSIVPDLFNQPGDEVESQDAEDPEQPEEEEKPKPRKRMKIA
jgi:hypothetical protein